VIYFIRCPDAGAIKIGTAYGILARAFARLSTMQSGCPLDLELVAVIDGGGREEAELHQRFAALRIRGEWFRYEGDLKAHVEQFPRPVKPYGTRLPKAVA
jgi:hypothetical protein